MKGVTNMEYIYVKVKPEKWNDFIELLDAKRVIYSIIGQNRIMFHKTYFTRDDIILDNSMVETICIVN